MNDEINELKSAIVELKSIIALQDTIINQLIEALQRFVDCEGLPCVKMAEEAAKRRADLEA